MVGAARQNSATVDEPSHLAAGYLHLCGHDTRLGSDDHPPLGQMIMALPVTLLRPQITNFAAGILAGELSAPWTMTWQAQVTSVQGLVLPGCEGRMVRLPPLGDPMVLWRCADRYPAQSWYYWGSPESQMFSKYFLYGGENDGDAMLFRARLMQVLVTLAVGVVIYGWVRRATGEEWPALLALAAWAFHPIALAYGPLANTDIGVTFGFAVAIFIFARFVQVPTWRGAVVAGAVTAVALAMKYTALLLGPVYLGLIALSWPTVKPHLRSVPRYLGVFLLAGWLVTMLVYFTRWTPAPPATPQEIAALQIPDWFVRWREVLLPPTFWKGIALTLGHAKEMRESYLCGQWSQGGWWYYLPVAFVLKSPVAFVVLLIGAVGLFLRQARVTGLWERAAWLGAVVYAGVAVTSGINIGVRHLLPALPLVCVGIGCAVARVRWRHGRWVAAGLMGWQMLVAVAAYPLYVQFFSEAVGGAKNGHRYLIDSNFDWGQDAIRLKRYLDENGIGSIYLDYFGVQFSTEHLKIPNQRVNAESARQIRQGTLVVSASQLMRPEWAWLRESRQPVARVAHTLFVFRLD